MGEPANSNSAGAWESECGSKFSPQLHKSTSFEETVFAPRHLTAISGSLLKFIVCVWNLSKPLQLRMDTGLEEVL